MNVIKYLNISGKPLKVGTIEIDAANAYISQEDVEELDAVVGKTLKKYVNGRETKVETVAPVQTKVQAPETTKTAEPAKTVKK